MRRIPVLSSLLFSRYATPLALSLSLACGGADGGGGGGTSRQCNSSNCSGCCLGGVCQPGNSAAGCGRSGGACETCDTAYQLCLPDQRCGIDVGRRWLLAAGSATIAATNNGASWDADGSPPEPYVVFDGQPTGSRPDTLNPTWNEGFVFTAAKLLGEGVVVQLFDEDLLSDDRITAPRTVRIADEDLARGGLTLTNWDAALRITLVLQRR